MNLFKILFFWQEASSAKYKSFINSSKAPQTSQSDFQIHQEFHLYHKVKKFVTVGIKQTETLKNVWLLANNTDSKIFLTSGGEGFKIIDSFLKRRRKGREKSVLDD